MAFTFFFRDIHTLEQLTQAFIPIVTNMSKIKIWDAGCAMGQEPFTFALLLSEKMGYFGFKKVHIDASDIDESNLFEHIVTSGIYSYSDLQRIPKEIFENYFKKLEGTENYQLIENVRNRVKFRKHDLLTLKPFDGNYNLVICKNVLLHFSPEQRIEVIKMFHSSLTEGGLLTTEQTQKMPPELNDMFKQISTNANVFQKI